MLVGLEWGEQHTASGGGGGGAELSGSICGFVAQWHRGIRFEAFAGFASFTARGSDLTYSAESSS